MNWKFLTLLAACASTLGSPLRAEDAPKTETAVFGAGCFWCVEAYFERVPGVIDVVSGYAGGTTPNPTYKDMGDHVETIKVTYDPAKISYRKLVDFFWTTHDVTNPDGVWPDFGPHYRSMILYNGEGQKAEAEASKKALEASGTLKKPVATLLVPLDGFYPAEDYHQDYVEKNPEDRYVREVAKPKLEKLKIPEAKE